MVLKRPAGSNGRFAEHSDLPSDLGCNDKGDSAEEASAEAGEASRARNQRAECPKAAGDFEQKRHDAERRREEAARQRERERREKAMAKAQAALDKAEARACGEDRCHQGRGRSSREAFTQGGRPVGKGK